jgi:methylated-DNA-[protein]-cysteine S-methyltransferase
MRCNDLDRGSDEVTEAMRLSAFLTRFGWFGVLGDRQSLVLITIGHASNQAVGRYAEKLLSATSGRRSLTEEDWYPNLRDRLQAFCEGAQVDFSDVETRLDAHTSFQRRVLLATRCIAYGQTCTYSELAGRIGAPRAARAVGNVLAANRFPIVIPCHRVVGAGGRLGGFSAPQGIVLKRRLLEMESAHADDR